MNDAEILEEAADLIEAGGLCKWALWNEQGQHCSIGALIKAAKKEQVFTMPMAAAKALAISLDLVSSNASESNAWGKVVYWNNHQDRTTADVVEAMRQAAKELRNEASP